MIYCIYHGSPLGGRRFDYGVSKDFVDQVIKAYLRGKSQITYSGRDYSVGSTALQIYEVPAEFGNAESVKKYFANFGHMYEGLLAEKLKNVTNDLLKDRSWAELKHDYSNSRVEENNQNKG